MYTSQRQWLGMTPDGGERCRRCFANHGTSAPPIPNSAVCRTKSLVLRRTFKDEIQARSGLLESTRDLGIVFVHGTVINTLTGVAFEM